MDRDFKYAVHQRDNWQCMNPSCPSRREGLLVPMDVHHVIPRAHGGEDEIRRCISFCRICHDRAGFKSKEPVRGHRFVLDVLSYWRVRGKDFWDEEVFEWLSNRIALKN